GRRPPPGRPSAPRRRPPPARQWRAGTPRRRLIALAVVAVLGFVAVVVRVGQLQITESAHYSAEGIAQRMTSQSLPADRGELVDRNGIAMAESLPQHAVFADPTLVGDKPKAAELLAPVLAMSQSEILSSLNKRGRFVYLRRQADDQLVAALRQLKTNPSTQGALAGVDLVAEPARFYPAGTVGNAVLGGVDNDGIGTGGLERQLNGLLTGKKGELRREVDKNDHTIPSGRQEFVAPTPGQQVVTTLDRALQYAVEQKTVEQVNKVNAKGGMAVAMDVTTGDIVAMANVIRDPKTGVVGTTSANLAVTDPYEPGSVNKVIAIAAALEAGAVAPDTVLDVPPELIFDKGGKYEKPFHDAEPHGDMKWTVQHILAQSSNIGTIEIAQKLQKQQLDAAFRSFGLGSLTGINFPGESKGIYRPLKDWSGTSVPTMAIGQGVAVTAVQMLAVYAAIANDGRYVTPRLVKATIGPDGKRSDAPVPEGRQVISSNTAQQLNQMLRDVVTEGTGTRADIPGYVVAGKTGTAQKPQPNGQYKDAAGVSHYTSSFVGFVPADNPKVAILVMVDDPNGPGGLYYASEVAAPLFQSVGLLTLAQLRIPPTMVAAPNQDAVANTSVGSTNAPAAAGYTGATAVADEPK
ncbi:MAG: ftsI, partial [Acidimicrobiia bacterium]|nr:ftsI [Acidimicrobiia bacterium]